MKKLILALIATALVVCVYSYSHKQAAKQSGNVPAVLTVGEAAPVFSVEDTNGQTVDIAALKGNIVVLEWTNYECPFVRKHYESHNMQSLQKKYTQQGVKWISIMSSAPGKQGHFTSDDDANAAAKERDSAFTSLIRDEDGTLGRMYGAKATPHMFIIDTQGVLVYMGAIDSINSADKDDIAKADNYVANALDALLAGQPIAKQNTPPYGCSVKYDLGL